MYFLSHSLVLVSFDFLYHQTEIFNFFKASCVYFGNSSLAALCTEAFS